ncbi:MULTISPECIES: hypothetical protein [Butyricimonas]|nr:MULTISPECIES: hypothetical protein [Butyricimonas]
MSKKRKEKVVYIPNQLYYQNTFYNRGENDYLHNKNLSRQYQYKLAKKKK